MGDSITSTLGISGHFCFNFLMLHWKIAINIWFSDTEILNILLSVKSKKVFHRSIHQNWKTKLSTECTLKRCRQQFALRIPSLDWNVCTMHNRSEQDLWFLKMRWTGNFEIPYSREVSRNISLRRFLSPVYETNSIHVIKF